MQRADEGIHEYRKRSVKLGVRVTVLSFLLLFMVVFMLWNTSLLNRALNQSTEQYVEDVSQGLARDLSYRMEADERSLVQLADAISRMEDRSLEEFLGRQKQLLDFSGLVLLSEEGVVKAEVAEAGKLDWFSYPEIPTALSDRRTLVRAEESYLIYFVPVEQDGTEGKVLAGLRPRSDVQRLIQSQSFDGNGKFCIVDRTGTQLLSSEDQSPLTQMENASRKDAEETAVHTEQMQADIAAGRSGVFSFTTAGGERLLLAYQPLTVHGWVLMTTVPANLISGDLGGYVLRTFLIVGGGLAAFSILLLILLVRGYQVNRSRLEKAAFVDPLTGGMTNAAFLMEAKKLVERASSRSYTLVLLNVQGFKLINENFGLGMGNQLLQRIYGSLKQDLQKDELLARGEADHFFLCLRGREPQALQDRVEQMVQHVNASAQQTDIPYRLNFSRGACVVEEPGEDLVLMEERARIASQFWRHGDRCVFYSTGLAGKIKAEQELISRFEEALEQGEFTVLLQPKIRLADGAIGGAEALVRWVHPERGLISPSEFIPILEKNGSVVQLDLFVFERVCQILDQWEAEGKRKIPVSVNLSRVHFQNPNFLRQYSQIRERYGIPGGLLELEVTESIFFDERQREMIQNSIQEMHAWGFRCSLDDFGSGFSSLSLLKETEADAIKLDRQFFGEIQKLRTKRVIASLIQLAHDLGMEVVAEGIETPEQLEFLRIHHCDLVQGFIFSGPLTASDFWEAERF